MVLESNALDEQEICVSCGFCCDQTLFDAAKLKDDEIVDGEFAKRKTIIEGSPYFKLPCPHFDGKCTIYNQPKPSICSAFKCQVLHDMNEAVLSKKEALQLVLEIKQQRDQLLADYTALSGETITFRTLFLASFKEPKFETKEYESIKFRTHLIDIMLSKHFKSQEQFDDFYEYL